MSVQNHLSFNTGSYFKNTLLVTAPLVLALSFCLPLNASAGEKEHKMTTDKKQLFKELDTNNDNKLSIAESEDNTVLMNDFDTVDKDGNNEIDMSEFMAFEPVERFEPPEPEGAPDIGAAPLE